MDNPIKVYEINEGQKIAYEQQGTRIFFGDDDLMVNVAKLQKDWALEVDIMIDTNGNLISGSGIYYVAQIAVPAIKYVETQAVPVEEGGTGEPGREPVPLDMGDVTLTLWSIDGLPA